MTTSQVSLAQNGIRALVDAVFYGATGEEAEIGIVKMTAGVGTLVQLPDPTTIGPRKPIVIMDESGTAGAATAQIITVMPVAGTINGLASIAIVRPYQSMTVYSDGKQWLCANLPNNPVTTAFASSPGGGVALAVAIASILTAPIVITVAAGEKLVCIAGGFGINGGGAPVGIGVVIQVDGASTSSVNLFAPVPPAPVSGPGYGLTFETLPLAAGAHTIDLFAKTTAPPSTGFGQLVVMRVTA